MKVITLLDDPVVIEKILRHLNLWPEPGAPAFGIGNEPFTNASHNLDNIFGDRYWDTHPEYYYMVRGKRHVGENRLHDSSVCYSNPGVVEVAAPAALAFFRGNPFRHWFSLGIKDLFAYCECDAWAKLQPPREFRGVRVASDMYYHFVNEVAKKVAAEFPDSYLGAIAPIQGRLSDRVPMRSSAIVDYWAQNDERGIVFSFTGCRHPKRRWEAQP